jgi:hypothetical protein
MALILSFVLTLFSVASMKAQTKPQAQTPAPAQTSTTPPTSTQTVDESTGKTSGNYNIQQSVEFGYRDSLIGGESEQLQYI